MSKRNMLLGLAAGKIGDLVFYRDGGEQRTRTRVIPKNPRSIAQQTQRSKIANASALYRLMASVLSGSFVNRPTNQSGFNAFSALAIPMSPYMTREQAAADCVLPMPAVVSKGTLPPLEDSLTTFQDDNYRAVIVRGQFTSSSTIGEVSSAIIAAHPTLSAGDRLTFVLVEFRAADDTDSGDDVYRGIPYITTMELDVASTASLSSIGMSLENMVLVPESYTGSVAGTILASTIIHSRVEGDGRLNVNNAVLDLTPAAKDVYDSYRTSAARDAAVVSYMGSNVSVLRD